jgi:hypothetical protein
VAVAGECPKKVLDVGPAMEPSGTPSRYTASTREQEGFPMRRTLIASLVGFGGTLALALALGAAAPSADTKADTRVDALACKLFIIGGQYKTICREQ